MQARSVSFWLCVSFVAVIGFIAPARAALIVFSDKATFLAASGASPATTIPTTPTTVFPPNVGFTSGSLTFSLFPPDSSRFVIDDFSPRLVGNEIGISGKESFDVGISSSVFSFGFDFVEPQFDPNVNGTFVESTFSVTLMNNATTVGSFLFDRPNDSAQFVGVLADVNSGFNAVQIREIVGDVENEFFGQFYTGARGAAVPEPGSFALLAVGVVGLAMMRRRKSA